MKLGVSAFAWTARFESSHLALLPSIKEMGLDGFEIPMFDPAALPIHAIRNAFETAKLECLVCAILPNQFNPISPEPSVRRAAIEHLTRCIETAAAMGCRMLGGPVFSPIGYLPDHRPRSEEWRWAVEAFQSLSDPLEACEVNLSVEPVNRSETFFLRTAADAKRLCEEIGNPQIGVTIDTFHANIEESSIPAAIRTLGPHLKHIHASENDRGPLGRGHVPFPEIMSALREIDYKGYLMIEGFGFDPSEQSAPGYLWAMPDVTPDILAAERRFQND